MIKPIFVLSIALGTGSIAFAQNYSDVAQVISAQPIYEYMNTAPRQECWNETITSERRAVSRAYADVGYGNEPRSTGAGAVVGAIVGGVIGRQFGGSHHGRNGGTLAGALVGGVIGNQVESSNHYDDRGYHGPAATRVDYIPESRNVQRCRTVNDAGYNQIRGYDVTYRYNGRDYTTRMNYDPGPTLRLNVNLSPQHTTNSR